MNRKNVLVASANPGAECSWFFRVDWVSRRNKPVSFSEKLLWWCFFVVHEDRLIVECNVLASSLVVRHALFNSVAFSETPESWEHVYVRLMRVMFTWLLAQCLTQRTKYSASFDECVALCVHLSKLCLVKRLQLILNWVYAFVKFVFCIAKSSEDVINSI